MEYFRQKTLDQLYLNFSEIFLNFDVNFQRTEKLLNSSLSLICLQNLVPFVVLENDRTDFEKTRIFQKFCKGGFFEMLKLDDFRFWLRYRVGNFWYFLGILHGNLEKIRFRPVPFHKLSILVPVPKKPTGKFARELKQFFTDRMGKKSGLRLVL